MAVSPGDADASIALADEALGRFDVEGGVSHLSAAIRALTAAGEKRRAAMACARLGDVFGNYMGNVTVGRVWFTRARRLLEGEPDCIEQGWIAVAAMGCEVPDPAELLASSDLALDRARRFGDVNLETKALADGGLALVQMGRITEGMARLDEAMALACGPADDVPTAAKSVCSFFTACYHAADFARVGTWAGLLRQRGLMGERGLSVILTGHCHSVQATLLLELGRWAEAESLLTRARTLMEAEMGSAWHPDIALADLRVRQGRHAEAEVLLVGKDQSMQALLPAARLHLGRSELDLARAAVSRGLRSLGDDQLRAVELLTALVDIEVAGGDLDAARRAVARLRARLEGLAVPSLRARADTATARLHAAAGDLQVAIETLEGALDSIDASRLPWLRATLLIELTRVRDRAGEHDAAVRLARAAAAALQGLDVVIALADSALLERLGSERRTERKREIVLGLSDGCGWWTVTFEGATARIKDTKGLRYVAELVLRAGAEQHALDLVDRIEGVSDEGVDRRDLGDVGPLLDGQARAQYRKRIEELRARADELVEAGNLEGAERAQLELDALVAELSAAFGLGGRDRPAGSVAERARLNVTRAIRSAITRVTEALPGAGEVLARQVRTGTFCAYEPGNDEVHCVVQGGMNGFPHV